MDTRVYYDLSDERLMRLQEFENTFQPSRFVLFAITSDEPIEQDYEKRQALVQLGHLIEDAPYLIRVDSLATVSYPFPKGEELVVRPFLEYMCPADKDCYGERAAELDSPIFNRRLVSSDRKTVAVVGLFNFDRDDTSAIERVAEASELAKREIEERFPNVTVHVTGGIPISEAFAQAGRRDSQTLFLFATVSMLIILRLMLGSFRNAVVMLATGLAAVVVSMGVGGWLGFVLNSASSTVPIVVMTLVIATTMHLFSHYLRLGETPDGATVAAKTALNLNVVPIVLTAATTSISLLSLSFISSPPAREFGILSALGVGVGGFLAVTAAPLLLKTGGQIPNSWYNRIMQIALNNYARVVSTRSWISVVAGLLLAFCAYGLTKIIIDDDFIAYLSERTEVRQSTEFALENLSGPSVLELSVTSEVGVFDPKFLRELNDLTTIARGHAGISSAVSLFDLLDRIRVAFGIDVELADMSEFEIAQLYLVYQLGLRAGESPTSLVSEDGMATHVTLLLTSTSAADVRDLQAEIETWLQNYESIEAEITGENDPIAHLSTSNIPAVAQTVAVSLFITAFILGLLFRNLRTGLNALFAILIPIACGVGAWGWISGSIGLAGTIVVAIALGVVIDDAIHLLYHQYKSLGRGDGGWESTSHSIHRVGVPIVSTTLLLVAGLAPLLFSDFQVNVTFAATTSLVIVVSLIFDLCVLPRLMTWAVSRADVHEESHVT